MGRRSWIIRLAAWGLPSPGRLVGLALLAVLLVVLLQPALLLAPALLAAQAGSSLLAWAETRSLADALPYLAGSAALGTALLAALAWLAARTFRESLFREAPLLRLLANTGPAGDLRQLPRLSRSLSADRARVLSRELVGEWYSRRHELPEFIVTATDMSARHECLFTLVRPSTYATLLERSWMAVQLEADSAAAAEYRSAPGALFTLPENLLQAIVASSAVPGAFPSQRIGIYGARSHRAAHHYFVDGGVLNNSPIRIAIDAGATHIISLEIRPFEEVEPLGDDAHGPRGYGLLQAALTTFTTVLERATDEDVRRVASWNRFLARRPQSLRPGKRGTDALPRAAGADQQRRIVPVYRIAPRQPLLGTVEFDGQFEAGRPTVTLREILRRGIVDMQGRNIWAATTRAKPEKADRG